MDYDPVGGAPDLEEFLLADPDDDYNPTEITWLQKRRRRGPVCPAFARLGRRRVELPPPDEIRLGRN